MIRFITNAKGKTIDYPFETFVPLKIPSVFISMFFLFWGWECREKSRTYNDFAMCNSIAPGKYLRGKWDIILITGKKNKAE